MARTEARIKTSIWNPDSRFCELPMEIQWTYFLILGQADLSLCGVAPMTVGRWASKASDADPEIILANLEVLEAERYVITDESTEEVLIRTFVRHDGILDGANQLVGMSRDFQGIQSAHIRSAFLAELPEWLPPFLAGKGSEGLPKGLTNLSRDRIHPGFTEAVLNPSEPPSQPPCETAPNPLIRGRMRARSSASASASASIPMCQSSDVGDSDGITPEVASFAGHVVFEAEFDAAWEIYPRKLKRKAALRAYTATRRRGADPAELAKAVKHYAQAKRGVAQVHILHGSTFFGPDEPWTDYVAGVPAADSPLPPAMAANGSSPNHEPRAVHPAVTW